MKCRVGLLLGLVVLAAAGCSSAASAPTTTTHPSTTTTTQPTTHRLTVTVEDNTSGGSGDSLIGGTTVTVKNQSGTIIATDGDLTGFGGDNSESVKFTVPDESFYSVTIGAVPGSISFSRSQLVKDGWVADISVTDN